MKTSAARIGLRTALVATALAVSLSLAGCLQSTTPLPGNAPTRSHSPNASDSGTPTVTPTPTPTQKQLVIDCDSLLTPAQVYAYNPNFVRDNAYKPKSGTVPAAIAAKAGQTCGWVNETSGVEVEIAVAVLPADQWSAAKASASAGTPLDTDGNQGYFAVTNGLGSAQFFYGSIWLDVSSTDFTTAADVQPLYPIVVQNQRSLGG